MYINFSIYLNYG